MLPPPNPIDVSPAVEVNCVIEMVVSRPVASRKIKVISSPTTTARCIRKEPSATDSTVTVS